ncbi:hypothetical protein ACLEC3_15545 [Lonsdalea quercina]|uniref:hypothetical protein n=1 Tax=Lonsdalea quercina TaxID=71657 RepID=UPI003975D2D6
MRKLNLLGVTIYVLDAEDSLVDCPVDSYAVFNDDGWMAVHRQAEQAIPLHIDPLPSLNAALNEVLSVALFFA